MKKIFHAINIIGIINIFFCIVSLSFNNAIFANTTTMRNRKYVSADGYFEAVYSYDGKLLNEGVANIDMGTYNYAPSTKGGFYMIYHLFKDMITYNVYKNSKKDLDDYLNKFSKKYEGIESK